MPRARLTLNLTGAARQIRQAGARGLFFGAEHVLGVSNDRAPIDEGALVRSGIASVDEARLRAAVAYDTPYAARQHEELTWRHAPGRRAKYLESALNDSRDEVRAVIAAQLRRAFQ